MPPRRGIVKSGNAGNSSKASKAPAAKDDQNTAAPEKEALFPPGFKYPLSLLNERVQKNGWDKPNVAAHKQRDGGYSFSVTLSRVNKKNESESVRLKPHPPYTRPSAIEARHWGATYALYRFCNGIQLNRVLPPGPREYWQQLAAEHKAAPDHQSWMYEADPFKARQAVDDRQKAVALRKQVEEQLEEEHTPSKARQQTSPEFEDSPEAKMSVENRDLVEESIKQGLELYPEADDSGPLVLDEAAIPTLQKQLQAFGFTPVQTRQATTALSTASPLASSLLGSLGPFQACLEYLILHVPECDLPKRFLPSSNSSAPFVSSTHSGTDDIKLRWMQEKAVKECGWPEHIVKECLPALERPDDWPGLVKALNRRLSGAGELFDDEEREEESIDEDEVSALAGEFIDEGHLRLPLPVAPFEVHILLPATRTIPMKGEPPPMYLTSSAAAAYVRLHMLGVVLDAYRDGALVDSGQSVIMAIATILEEAWAMIQDEGPPDISHVLRHMLPTRKVQLSLEDDVDMDVGKKRRGPRGGGFRQDERSDERVREDFQTMNSNPTYKNLLKTRERLPAYAAKEQFLDMLARNQCVVVVGETGCGKTTQLPQFVLDSLILANRGASASIIITQPRRLSAIGVSARVSAERVDDGSVGYAIRGESKQDKYTKLLFCTTGVVLRRLGAGDKLKGVTHVMVDEVHERSIDGDFLMLELKELLKHRPNLKVVLMSATINHETFAKYFGNAPLLAIPGLAYPVEDLYLEQYFSRLSYTPSGSNGRGAGGRLTDKERKDLFEDLSEMDLDSQSIPAMRAIIKSDRIDYGLIAALVKHIVTTAEKVGGILIFLPGVQEIRQCIESLRSIGNAKIFPLHANLSSTEQRAVFATVPGWKVVVATNVAETSITIDDIIYVIDSGKVKETRYDPENGLTRLEEQWVTRAAAKQRRGRAGRTQPGVCYKLYTKKQENRMGAYPIPEIRRVALESVALTVKVVHDDVKNFLSRAIDPPEMTAIDHALKILQELGAITDTGELTPLGQNLAMIPVDLRLGKMMVLGTIFRCLGPILNVAAALSSKPIFFSPMDKREEANQARQRFATANSDILTDINAFEEALKAQSSGMAKARIFCEDNFIAASTVRDMNVLRQEYLSNLVSLNLVPHGSTPTTPALNSNSAHTGLLKAILLAGLWPRVARVTLPPGAIKFDRVQAGTVQRANEAKQYKFFDVSVPRSESARVFLHPASVLFSSADWKSPFVVYFQKQMTSKVFLRDATEVPIYALLLFGGPVSVNHVGGGLTIGRRDAYVKLKAWPRIGVLVNQLRRLLDFQMKRCVDEGTVLEMGKDNPVMRAVLALLQNDGLTASQ